MRSVIMGVAGIGGLGVYALTGHGPGQSVDRIVDRSPAATFASFEEALKPLSYVSPQEQGFGEMGSGAMKFAYKSEPGKHITLTVLMNGADVADMEFDFAPAERPNRTKMTVALVAGAEAPPQMQIKLALGERKVFEQMVDETVRRVELGLPVAPEFARLGQTQDAVEHGESLAEAARNPQSHVREEDYKRMAAQEAASAPASDAGRPMVDVSR